MGDSTTPERKFWNEIINECYIHSYAPVPAGGSDCRQTIVSGECPVLALVDIPGEGIQFRLREPQETLKPRRERPLGNNIDKRRNQVVEVNEQYL